MQHGSNPLAEIDVKTLGLGLVLGGALLAFFIVLVLVIGLRPAIYVKPVGGMYYPTALDHVPTTAPAHH